MQVTRQRLAAEGIVDAAVLDELQARDPRQIEAVIAHVAACRRPDDPRRPGLIVHLTRHDFGTGAGQPVRARRTASAAPAATVEDAELPSVERVPAGSAIAGEAHTAWQRVCDQLRAALPPDDYVTWIAPLRLLDDGAGVAVIQTPNIFAREEIEGRLYAPLVAACTQYFGPAISLHFVIAPPPTAVPAGADSSRRR
jgi:hypothetical protein